MQTFTKILLTGVVLATVGAGAAVARMGGHGGPGEGGLGPMMGGPGMARMHEKMCASDAKTPDGSKMAALLTKKLNLTDAQKPALADLQAAFAKSHADSRTALCAEKPDFTTVPGRMGFGLKAAEIRLNGAKLVQPKLEAFYNALTDDQKKAFNEMHRGKGDREGGGHHKGMMQGDDQQ